MSDPVSVSVVIPLHNEEEVLPLLHQRLTAVLDRLPATPEVVFVDDGSTDRTAERAAEIHAKDPRFKLLRFSRNFGQQVAIMAGLEHSRGEACVVMDADLQDAPEDIPVVLAKLHEGHDVVFGIKDHREGSLLRRLGTAAFWKALRALTGFDIPSNLAVLRAMNRPAVRALLSCREQSPFLTGLTCWIGFRRATVPVSHHPRAAGKSHYPWTRLIRLVVAAVTSFSYIPLRMGLWLGFFASAVSLFLGVWFVVKKLIWGIDVTGWASQTILMTFLGGIQLILVGMVGEYVGRIYTEVQNRPSYLVSGLLGLEAPPRAADQASIPGSVGS